ncbi:MAG: hypothetical protein R3332_13855, partial [Pseudohongiellaceae bacterium]|nr:hypothetical protein [Pseudohongiellaceae bacterium]
MFTTRRSIRRFSKLTTACLFTGLGVFAQAQDLNVQNGAITVTGESAFSANPTVASTGLVSQVTGIPLATNQLVPGFSFTLLNEGVADGTYTFRIGMTVDDDNSQR